MKEPMPLSKRLVNNFSLHKLDKILGAIFIIGIFVTTICLMISNRDNTPMEANTLADQISSAITFGDGFILMVALFFTPVKKTNAERKHA